MFLIDKIRGKHIFKIGFAAIVIVVLLVFKGFSKFCDNLFDVAAYFLRCFDPFGMDYTAASVIICLLVPLIIYIILIKKTYLKK
jgi:hypothetical protein